MKNSQNACNPFATLGNRQALENDDIILVGNLYESERDKYDGKNFFGVDVASAWQTVQRANKESRKNAWMI